MSNLSNPKVRLVVSILATVAALVLIGFAWTGPYFAQQEKNRAEAAILASKPAVVYTYNIKGTIRTITGVYNEKSSSNAFKYIVCADFEETARPEVLSDAEHVLPAISGGRHCIPIPDTDIAGYVDWEKSRSIVDNPVNSFGVKMAQYILREGVSERMTTFSCHEVLGSSGAAELICSEF